MGICSRGIWECTDGEPVCAGSIPPSAETCNNIDDDCDGSVDNDVPDDGPCGDDEGACVPGTRVCISGRFVCDGSIGPVIEECNDVDDDCDGELDEELFQDCTSDCGIGERECVGGFWSDCSAQEPSPEVCDGLDNDCDGMVDNVDDSGTVLTRPCTIGDCTGVETCNGPDVWTGCTASVPTDEYCDGEDNDCNGSIDDVDPAILESDSRNCGSCGNDCRDELPNAVVRCVDSGCQMSGCLPGYYDIDPMEPGCEYPCEPSGREVCNGVDDDCDGMVDNADATGAPLTQICRNGVCAGTETCVDADWAGCTAQVPDTEVCDGVDNDCDGIDDEGFSVGLWCPMGEGACQVNGHYECHPTDSSQSIRASSTTANPIRRRSSRTRFCNGLDDDCNGVDDDNILLANFDVVSIIADVDLNSDGVIDGGSDEIGFEYSIFRYEASHPDATDTDAGSIWTWACSNDGVIPWGGMSWRDAEAACCGLNDDRQCHHQGADVVGGVANDIEIPLDWALCMAPMWEVACQVGDHPTDPELAGAPYLYPYELDTYRTARCNGFDAGYGTVLDTGQLTNCRGGDETGWTGEHYDMSGNLHEWTWTGWFACGCDRTSGCDDNNSNHNNGVGCDCDPDCFPCACDTDYGTYDSRCQYNCNCDPDCNTYYEYRGGSYNSGEFGLSASGTSTSAPTDPTIQMMKIRQNQSQDLRSRPSGSGAVSTRRYRARRMTMNAKTIASLAVLGALLVQGASAEAQARPPHIMVLVDTSGSMLEDTFGDMTAGDGSTGWNGVTSFEYDGPWDTGDTSRLHIAKDVLSEVILSVGVEDVVFGLARYYQDDDYPGMTFCPNYYYSDLHETTGCRRSCNWTYPWTCDGHRWQNLSYNGTSCDDVYGTGNHDGEILDLLRP